MRFIISLDEMQGPALPTRLIDPQGLPERQAGIYDYNRSYHCPRCGRIWAEWRIEDDLTTEWYPVRASCGNHPHGMWTGDNPGSLIKSHFDLMVLPPQLLERELFLLLEKGIR